MTLRGDRRERRASRVPDPLRHNRDFRLLWIGQTASEFGSRASALAYPLLVLAATGSATKAGFVVFAFAAPLVGLQLVAGTAVDRLNRKRVLIVADVGRLLAVGSIAVMLFSGNFILAAVMIAAAVEGTLTAAFELAELAVLRQLVPRAQLTLAASRNEIRTQVSALGAPPAAGALFGLSRAAPFALDAATYVVSLICVTRINTGLEHRGAEPPHGFWQQTSAGVRWLWRHRLLRACALVGAGTNLIFASLPLILIVRVTELGASKAIIGIVIAAGGVGGILGAALAPRLQERMRPERVILAMLWYWAAGAAAFAFIETPLLLGVAYAVMVAAIPTLNVVIVSLRIALSPDDIQGRVHAGSRLLGGMGMVIGPPIAGVLLDRRGAFDTLVALAVSLLLLASAATVARPFRLGSPGDDRTGSVDAATPRGGNA